MAMVRYLQSYFMNNDLEMYDEAHDLKAQVRTMTLSEELGQIAHIFSDKTGTLTCNVMNFRKASIYGVSYGKGLTEIGRVAWKQMKKHIPEQFLEDERKAIANSVPHVSFYCPDYERDIKGITGQDLIRKRRIRDFYRYLALCHEVIVEDNSGEETKFSAPNPDDEALVCAAGYFGFEFKDRINSTVKLFDKEESKFLEIQVLYIIPFTSSRKRMSVIIRDLDGQIKLICKGADSALLSRADANDKEMNSITMQHVDQFSLEGLRCLILAYKLIDDAYFQSWSKSYNEAVVTFSEIEKKKRGETNLIETLEDSMEKDMHIIGATAIEDRLQDGVAECIESLTQKAGIKVWMLTGDKQETAINIGIACNLLLKPEHMVQLVLNQTTAPSLKRAVALLRKEVTVSGFDDVSVYIFNGAMFL